MQAVEIMQEVASAANTTLDATYNGADQNDVERASMKDQERQTTEQEMMKSPKRPLDPRSLERELKF